MNLLWGGFNANYAKGANSAKFKREFASFAFFRAIRVKLLIQVVDFLLIQTFKE